MQTNFKISFVIIFELFCILALPPTPTNWKGDIVGLYSQVYLSGTWRVWIRDRDINKRNIIHGGESFYYTVSGVNNLGATTLIFDATNLWYIDTQTFSNAGASTVTVFWNRNSNGVREIQYSNSVFQGNPSSSNDNINSYDFTFTLASPNTLSVRVMGIYLADSSTPHQFWGVCDVPTYIHVSNILATDPKTGGTELTIGLTSGTRYFVEAQFAKPISANFHCGLYYNINGGAATAWGDLAHFVSGPLQVSSSYGLNVIDSSTLTYTITPQT